MARAIARLAAVLAAIAAGVSLYTAIAGHFRLDLGSLRLSAGTWEHPLWQAAVLALVAALFYWRDARRRGTWDAVPRAIAAGVRRTAARMRLHPWLWAGVCLGAFVSLLVCHAIVRQWEVVGSAAAGSEYGYRRGFDVDIVRVFALVMALVGVTLRLQPRAAAPRAEWVMVGLWLGVGLLAQAILRSLAPFSLDQIFVAEGANSFYTVTQQYDAGTVLHDFTRLRDGWPLHASSNMPGKLLLLYGLELLSGQPATLAWLLVLLSNLGGIVLYLLVRDLSGDRRVALWSFVLYLFVPARIYFFPLLNTVTPVIGFGWALLTVRWLQRGRPAYAVMAGVALYALILFEPLPLVLGLLIAMVAARALGQRLLTWTALFRGAVWLVAAFLTTWAIVRAAFGFDLFQALWGVMGHAAAFNANEQRSYRFWVGRNLLDFLVGAGAGAVVVFVCACIDGARAAGSIWRWFGTPAGLVALAAVLAIGGLDLAGVNRGEAIRLWIFLACLVQVPVAWACARLDSRVAVGLVLASSILQAALGLAMIGFVVV